ncbi:hypothetical protein FPCIR_12924 [Fusarium pseudocircinatum]|uniref:Uncharacterized protein n=1 Tax=Fusarium pseudocircinatum TaxID=56676 RepID=A0A8H5NT10_9HYPO|nr:hypothetical protein FPCIR_12924 [Fusarium pseudocircinatum]
MPPAPLPLDGPFHHGETPRRDIASLKVTLARARYLATELNQRGHTGGDDATEAGYNSESRSEALVLTKECQAVADVARSVQAETNETAAAIREVQVVRATPSQAVTPALRREAIAQILETLTGSRQNLITMVRQVLSDARLGMGDVSLVTDSQTVRWIDGAQQMPQLAALQQTIQQKDEELSTLKGEVETKSKVAFDYQRRRHQLLTNIEAEKAKVSSAERQLSRAREETRRANERVGTLEEELRSARSTVGRYENDMARQKIESDEQISAKNEEIDDLIRQVQDLDEANIDLEDEKETLAYHLLERDRSLDISRLDNFVLEERLESAENDALTEQAIMDHMLKTAQKEAQNATSGLEQTEGRLRGLEAQLDSVQGDLDSSRQEAEETRSTLERTISSQEQSLKSKTDEIERLNGLLAARDEQLGVVQRHLDSSRQEAEEARSTLERTISNQKDSLKSKIDEIGRLNGLLTARDETVDSQVEQASILLRRMSLNVESGIWRNVVEGILADSTVAPAAQVPWKPWRVLPSWSHDESLHVREDDRSIHMVAVDIIAILRIPSASAGPLLSRLQSLQEMLVNTSPLASTISQQLLESLAGAVGDERLHLIHHVLICQIVYFLNGGAIEHLDPRATALVSALVAWDPESDAGFNMMSSVSYPEFALVGFNHNPAGIVAVNPSDRELLWIDEARVNTMLTHIELTPGNGDPISLPLDTRERQMWRVAHL